jgi:hypothetical protein
LAAVAPLLLAMGCQLGPEAMRVGHEQYSEAVRQLKNEQLLLNLVRMRYTDAPIFLQIGSISTQFVFQQSGSVSGTLTENVGNIDGKNPDLLNLTGSVGYEERPTITYTVPSDSSFLQQLLLPITVDKLALIAESIWSGGSVMRLAVERLNALDNAPRASGPTPSIEPSYEGFLEAVSLMRTLAYDGVIGFQYEERLEPVSDPIPTTALQTMGMSQILALGVMYQRNDDGTYTLMERRRVLVMRFGRLADTSSGAQRLRELLRLDPSQTRFELMEYDDSVTDDLDPEALWGDLALNTRSVLGIMYYASKAVQVPEEHLADGSAKLTLDDQGEPFDWNELIGDLFVIQSSKSAPGNAAIRVNHRGYWFYIADDDHASKSTFSLLLALSSLASVPVDAAKPVLTLPVGG